MRSARNLILAFGLGLAVACSDATAPGNVVESTPSLQLGRSAQTRHEQLKQLLEAEKERIKREKEQGKSAYELARAEWKVYRQQLKQQLKRAKKLRVSVAVELLRCEPQPLEGDAAIIGPDGGTLHLGKHELVIPRGALTEEQVIVGRAPTSSLVAVDFEPEGLQFQRPAELTLSYDKCDVPARLDPLLVYLGRGNRILELPVSRVDESVSEVIGDIHHFSRYAVAY